MSNPDPTDVGARPVVARRKIAVYLLDDHEMVRAGVRTFLEAAGDVVVVVESGSAVDASTCILALHPDVAILDARLPDGSGIEVCRTIRLVDPSIQALILTSYDDDRALFSAIMANAAGYVLKEVRNADLVAAVRRVASGQSLIDPALVARVLDRVRTPHARASELAELTDQEMTLLALIGEGLTNRQIGEQMLLSEKTVKNYVSNVLAKLGVERRTKAAVIANRLLDAGAHGPDPVAAESGAPSPVPAQRHPDSRGWRASVPRTGADQRHVPFAPMR